MEKTRLRSNKKAGLILWLLCLTLSVPLTTFSSAKKKSNPKVVELSGSVLKCHDGDTCRVMIKNKSTSIRLSGIDAPEIKQEYGQQARDFLESLIKNKLVELKCDGKSFDRTTCTVFLNELNVNEEMVKTGWAFDSPKYSGGKYLNLQNQAMIQKKGIWSAKGSEKLMSPFCFRSKKNKKCQTAQLFMP